MTAEHRSALLPFLLALAACAAAEDRVPDEIIGDGDYSMQQFAGGWGVEFPRFERWLVDGDADRRRIALKDSRLLDRILEAWTEGTQRRRKEQVSADDHQVRDLAYQLLAKRYGLPGISYRDDRQKRDQAIARMLAIVDERAY